MNIDLVYYFREVNHFYYLNGPEKVNGNIVNNSPSYQLSSANDVVTKINQMIASLAPDITNVVLVTSELYTGNIQVNTYSGELNVSSDVPDYTQILTNINTNLTNLNSKFESDGNSIASFLRGMFNSFNNGSVSDSSSDLKNYSFIKSLDSRFFTVANNQQGANIASVISNIFQYSNGSSSIRLNNISSDNAKNKSNIINILLQIVNGLVNNVNVIDDPVTLPESKKYLSLILSSLKQSVSPNASITDVISALNTTIDSKQDTTIVNNEVTPLAEINIDVPFEVKNLKKSDVENL